MSSKIFCRAENIEKFGRYACFDTPRAIAGTAAAPPGGPRQDMGAHAGYVGARGEVRSGFSAQSAVQRAPALSPLPRRDCGVAHEWRASRAASLQPLRCPRL